MHVLIATDGSFASRAALSLWERLLAPAATQVTLLTVPDEAGRSMVAGGARGSGLKDDTCRLLKHSAGQLEETGWGARPLVPGVHVADQLVQAVGELGVDLAVLGLRDAGVARRFRQRTVLRKLMKKTDCSLLVVRPNYGRDWTEPYPSPLRVLVAYDGSQAAQRAIEVLASLPLESSAEVIVVRTLVLMTAYRLDILQEQAPSWHELTHAAHAGLQKAAQILSHATPRVTAKLCKVRDVGEGILTAASAFDADLIVVGSTGRSCVCRFLRGSVSRRVASRAKCSVLLVRHSDR